MRHFDATWDDRIITNHTHYAWRESHGTYWSLVIEPLMPVGTRYFDGETRKIYVFLGDTWLEQGAAP
jgi:hypothetical protein